MKKVAFLLGALLTSVLLSAMGLRADAQTEDEKAIRALVQRLATAYRAKDIPTIMSTYVPDKSLLVFALTPPLLPMVRKPR